MGYTHYHAQQRAFTAAEWELITQATHKILASQPKGLICGGNGEGEATVDTEEICFNGNNEDDQSHETFHITKRKMGDFNFCKTAQKPYDTAVVAVLCVIHFYAPGVLEIGSDGEQDDWRQGLELAQTVNKDITCPLKY